MVLRRFMTLIAVLVLARAAAAQEEPAADTGEVFYQEYLNRLMDDLRLWQLQELSGRWGLSVDRHYFRMNRSFWEERLSLSLSMGLSANNLQKAALEYRLRPNLTARAEVGRQADHSEAWLDLIFHFEY